MKNRVSWFILSCLMVVALVLASCAPAAKPTAPTTPTTPTTPTAPMTPATPIAPTKPVVTEPTKPIATEEPKFGGTVTVTLPSWTYFDTYRYDNYSSRVLSFVGEMIAIGDWAVDRKLWDYPSTTGGIPPKYIRGQLVESWEMPDLLTIILHIRQGVHFQDKPPVNGRELTADDIVWNIERARKSPFTQHEQTDYIASVNKKDKWTVEVRLTPPPNIGMPLSLFEAAALVFWPKEAMGKSGVEIDDWHNIIGTGPFMIADYVPDSAVTFKRNPSYWGFDERHPDNQLPYADIAKILLISDPSTVFAAMRTGKVDWLPEVQWQDADSLTRTTPRLLSRGLPAANPPLFRMRNDLPPFKDVRVRQAINMALDRNEMIKSFYGGHATYYCGVLSLASGLYVPYEKLPDKPMWTTVSCKEVYTYNPQKAKELLAEAGYPNGFKTQIDTTYPRDPGIAEILQSYLAKIGIEARINVQEYSVYNTVRYGRQNPAIVYGIASTSHADPFFALAWLTDGHLYNTGCVNDPLYQDLFYKGKSEFDEAKREKMCAEMNYRYAEMAFSIDFPINQLIIMWQPWIKGYAGEGPPGTSQIGSIWARVWVDHELKKSLGF